MSALELENTDITEVEVENKAVKFIFRQTNYFSRAKEVYIKNVELSAVFEGFDMQFADMIDEIQGREMSGWDGSKKQLKAIIEGKRIHYYELLGKNRLYLLLIKRNRISASWMKVYISFNQVKTTGEGISSSGFGVPSWMTEHYLKNAVDWRRPLETQRAALDQLCEIDDTCLHEYVIPGTRGDGDKAAALIRMGYPRIEGIVDRLLGWLMDMN